MKETEFSEVKNRESKNNFANICEEYIYAFKNQFFDKENYDKVFKKITNEFSKNNKFCDRCLCSLSNSNNPEHPYLIRERDEVGYVSHVVTAREFQGL